MFEDTRVCVNLINLHSSLCITNLELSHGILIILDSLIFRDLREIEKSRERRLEDYTSNQATQKNNTGCESDEVDMCCGSVIETNKKPWLSAVFFTACEEDPAMLCFHINSFALQLSKLHPSRKQQCESFIYETKHVRGQAHRRNAKPELDRLAHRDAT